MTKDALVFQSVPLTEMPDQSFPVANDCLKMVPMVVAISCHMTALVLASKLNRPSNRKPVAKPVFFAALDGIKLQ